MRSRVRGARRRLQVPRAQKILRAWAGDSETTSLEKFKMLLPALQQDWTLGCCWLLCAAAAAKYLLLLRQQLLLLQELPACCW